MQINTDKARLLIDQEYAETDEYARIKLNRTIITGTGMRAHFNEGLLEVLNDVQTTIEPK